MLLKAMYLEALLYFAQLEIDHVTQKPKETSQSTCAHWASYVVGGITQLKVKILLDFAKSQIAEENSKVCASDL